MMLYYYAQFRHVSKIFVKDFLMGKTYIKLIKIFILEIPVWVNQHFLAYLNLHYILYNL